ncbi:tRNA uridine-5-carboxymethylaminomethyl(34) synthesis GTPase MnmE [Entomospira entomophila]|uniref:tRNA modification GTPase MnmE n=1 Tax=Entomospira entomophila TaxID=2719988 RepID=A0A968G9I8_9SPIO|nr:tRNA uridine-5-carboxymethylaminomethyl(34) synthesis GTPase MnmE [Entomospira entomophilus]NIZ40417.1 tRNA uridine-5-carboxymethylaminomethyl(34) synthesis GTPase MnmE [Entomospira entomophilus]WDI35975.1 tRNA uridine-5-carboxymethylaminomethyl(34) synthesis GTPase MnmE [Entomospira entomophilus]
MINDAIYDQSPMVALATPMARSALAVIRLSGSGVITILSQIFDRRLSISGKLVFGRLHNKEEIVDEVMIVPFLGGSGYTGEEAAEIFCHGNPFLIQRVIDLCVSNGCRLALPGEFSYRAVKNGKIDMTQAEAVHELIMAQTDLASQSAMTRLSGQLGHEVREVYQVIIDQLGAIEAYLDYPEEELDEFIWRPLLPVINQLKTYLQHEPVSQILQDGARIVIAGEPNVGKSSLFNWFLGEERAIVSATAGTTRDYIESMLDIQGYPIRLIDTAGLRHTEEEIEQQGIQKSYDLLKQADVILYVFVDPRFIDQDLCSMHKEKLIFVQNKCDTCENYLGEDSIAHISVREKHGLSLLVERIIAQIDPENIARSKETALLGSVRQKELVRTVLQALQQAELLVSEHNLDLVAFSLRQAAGALSEFLGSDIQDDAMQAMFRQFCLGK